MSDLNANFTPIAGSDQSGVKSETNDSQTYPNTNIGSQEGFSVNLFGHTVYPSRWIQLIDLAFFSSCAMVIGCVLPYVPQYMTIRRLKSCAGFSTFVCFTLLLANILRIAFYIGEPFELPLLIQSVFMIIAQLLLLELCVRTKKQYLTSHNFPLVEKTLFSLKPKWFWRWTDLASYLGFLLIISAITGLAVYFFKDCNPFIQTLGYISSVTESMLGLPQVIKNYRSRSVQGMSYSMVLMWLTGDIYKLVYFIVNQAPTQFHLCGTLQISIDMIVLCQICLYRHKSLIKISKEHGQSDSPKEMMAL